jgi:thiamine biosynthesis lipoprotein
VPSPSLILALLLRSTLPAAPDAPPSAVPPSTAPASTVPPSAVPPSTVPPSTVPPSTVPPSAVPPSGADPTTTANAMTTATSAPTASLRRERLVRGEAVSLLVWGRDDAEAHAAVEDALDEYDAARARLFDDDDAPLGVLNALAGRAAVRLPADVFDALFVWQRVRLLSDGAFDVAAGALDAAWDPTEGGLRLPARGALAVARRLVGGDDLGLDPITGTARLRKPGLRVDARHVARGHAFDRARAVLLQRGVLDFALAAGGDVLVNGRHGDRPWRAGVQDPRGPGPFLAFPVDATALGGAVMTASDNEGAFFVDGVRYHALLDPRTGRPATRTRSATVLFADAAVADALADAVFVLGEREGLALVARFGAHAVIVTADNRVVLSPVLARMAQERQLLLRPPTARAAHDPPVTTAR